ncbi:T9SS type A sorting domain-containing protein [Adhaeribacter terreus]|uniref:T9SS type A sorting domain-containing protein n=1 Tax=Adhaeribacter terreus TaxID=529703 RepID=A0ABW0EA43_9BACT
MKTKSSFTKLFRSIFLAASLFSIAQVSEAQVNITSLAPYKQNFDGMPQSGSFTDNVTLPGWSVSYTGAKTITGGDGSNTATGLRSFGKNNETDRALGGVTNSTTGDILYDLKLKNTTGSDINTFIVSYTLEEWRGMKKEPFEFWGVIWWYTAVYGNMTFEYKVGSGSWVSVADLNVTGGVSGADTEDLPVDGELNKTTLNAVIKLSSGLGNNSEITYRWKRPDNNAGNYMAIDDVSITPVAGNVYFSSSSGTLTNTGTWGTNANGSGTRPSAMNIANATFIYVNRSANTNLPANWSLGNNSKLIVAEGALSIPSNRQLTGTIDVSDNATLNIQTSNLPVLGTLGDYSTINFNNSGTTLPNRNYGNLIVNGGKKNLSGNVKVKSKLTLNSKIELGNFDLALEDGASIENASATNYIVAKGNGRLKMKVKNNNQDVVFPVGTDTRYLPISLKQTDAAVTDNFSVKVIDGVYSAYDANNNPTGALLTENGINKTWIIDEEVIGNANVSVSIPVSLTSLATDLLVGFDISEASISHFENNHWDDVPAGKGLINTINAALGQYEIVRSNITSFSPFYVKSGVPIPLPVELVSFAAKRTENGIVCSWKTAQELNNNFFTVERSADGLEFIEAGTVKGKGTTSQPSSYSFTELNAPASLTYYRLKQTDFDGTVSYSKIVSVASANKTTIAFELYPNPSAGRAVLQTPAELTTLAKVSILNAQGQLVKEQNVTATELRKGFAIDLAQEPAGIYTIRIVAENKATFLRMAKQ